MRLVLIGLLCLLAQVPLWWIEGLVKERAYHRQQAVSEVERSWGGARRLLLPHLEIPLRAPDGSVDRASPLVVAVDQAGIDLQFEPEVRRRGLFDVVLYRADIDLDAAFVVPDREELAAALDGRGVTIEWERARLVLEVEDTLALDSDVTATIGGTSSTLIAESGGQGTGAPGRIRLATPVRASPGAALAVDLAFVARGSGDFLVVPGAARIDVLAASTWPAPAFVGARLPTDRELGENGFSAHWSLSGANLPLPRWALAEVAAITESGQDAAFGVRLVEPVDSYRMTERAVKYGLLFVVTTFLVYLVFEASGRAGLHLVHYGLVALALCLFYVLLLSLAELWGFGPAYLASAAAVLIQTGLFTRSIAGSWVRSAVFVAVLGCAYGWLYILLDMEELSLLGGALGLFALLSAAMYVMRGLGGASAQRAQHSTSCV